MKKRECANCGTVFELRSIHGGTAMYCDDCRRIAHLGDNGRSKKKRIAKGLCRHCGKPRERLEVQRCNACAKKDSERAKERHNEYVAQGLCGKCGKSRERKDISICNACNNKLLNNNYRHRERYRYTVISAYTKGKMCCMHCGSPIYEVLEVDHIDNNGTQHREEVGGTGTIMYRWIMANDYPDFLQVLCSTCHRFKTTTGTLPTREKIIAACNTQLAFLESK